MMKYRAVAEYFVKFANDCGDPLTHLKLQKLVYYAQAWHLALNEGTPLFDDYGEFEAWQHGPVNRALYREFADCKSSIINHDVDEQLITQNLDLEELEFLHDVADVYFRFGAYELELMTHQETPWQEARGDLAPDAPSKNLINPETMRVFYYNLSQPE